MKQQTKHTRFGTFHRHVKKYAVPGSRRRWSERFQLMAATPLCVSRLLSPQDPVTRYSNCRAWDTACGTVPHPYANEKYWLVVDLVDLPLWKIWVSWDDDIPNIWTNEKCSKPPTSICCVLVNLHGRGPLVCPAIPAAVDVNQWRKNGTCSTIGVELEYSRDHWGDLRESCGKPWFLNSVLVFLY